MCSSPGEFARFLIAAIGILAFFSPRPAAAAITLEEALDDPALAWTTGGNAGWFGQNAVTHDGIDAAESGDISGGQVTRVQTTVAGTGILTFYWKVSSEGCCDILAFYINGVMKAFISGAVDWEQRTFEIKSSGSHALKWEYKKDYSVSGGLDTGWLDEVVFTAQPQAGAPAGITVPADSNDGTYTVSWVASITNGVTYVLEEATNSAFTAGLRTAYTGTELSASIGGKTDGAYYYRVKATKSGYYDSDWTTASNGCAVSLQPAGAPAGVTVPETDDDGTFTVSWGASITNGVTYVLEEATDSAFTAGLRTAYTGTALSASIEGKNEGTYYYRVKATKTGYADSDWAGGTNGCVVSWPVADAPAGITVPATDDDGTFTVSWGASITNGVTYVLEEATDGAFTSGLRTAYSGLALSVSITGRESGRTYFYRVKAVASGYNDSDWMPGDNGCVVSITAGTPVDITVPATDNDGEYTVSWGASSTSGVTYVLEEATDSAFTTGLRTAYAGTSLSASIEGRTDGTYYYRVKATRSGYVDSGWTGGVDGCAVSLIFVEAPGGITVPSSSVTPFYTVSWGASVTNGVTYVLEESTDGAFTNGLRTAYTGTALSATITGNADGIYYYRVKATKSGLVESGWVAGSSGCAVTLLSLGEAVDNTALAWATGGSARWFGEITVSSDGADAAESGDIADGQISWVQTSVAEEGTLTFYWKVSSEECCDKLRFYIDGAEKTSISGGVDWQEETFILTPGSHALRWDYRKDFSVSGGMDKGWLDQVAFVPASMTGAGAPTGITVPAIDNDGTFTVGWGASSTSDVIYVLEEATDSAFAVGVRVAYIGTALSTSITGRAHGTTYYYRVKATKDGFAESAWMQGGNGCTVRFPAGKPAGITVPATDNDGTYTVSWGASITNGVTYVLEEATDSAFTAGLRTAYTGTALSASITGRTDGTYYYRVKATSAEYADSGWTAGSNGCTVSLPPAGPPAGITVPATDNDGTYTVSWGASITNGVTYVLEEATDGTFTAGVRTAYAGAALSVSITGRTTGKNYYYRVKATATGYSDSGWMTAGNGCQVRFPTGAPSGITVPISNTTGAYTVSWGASSTAGATYVLEEATNAAFSNGLRTAYSGTALSASITDRTDGTYYYRVKATRAGYAGSGWTTGDNSCTVSLPPPAGVPAGITVPTEDTDDGSYTVAWGPSSTTGVLYVLEEATDSGFTTGLREAYVGAELSNPIEGRTTGTTYYYRVKATKAGYRDSEWTTAGNGCRVSFPAGEPSGITVPISNSVGAYTVSWGASVTNGVTYVLEEATDSAFTTGKTVAYTGTDLSASITGKTDGSYYYRVKATKTGYTDSGWVTGGNACLVDLPDAEAPSGITVPPSDNDDGTYVVSWGASVTNGVTYVLEEATDNAFTTGLRAAYAGTELSAPVTDRTSGVTYYYRVKATRSGYTDSAWREGANGCVVSYPAGAPGSITVPASSNDGAYTVSWGASGTEGVTYVLEEATDGAFTTGLRTAYTGTGLSAPMTGRTDGSYYYRVKAAKTGYIDSAWVAGGNGCTVTLPPQAAMPDGISVPLDSNTDFYVVSWGASVTNGVTYVLEEATNGVFTAGLRTAYSGTSLNSVITGRSTGATYYYRVKAVKSGHTDSAWVEGSNGCSVLLPAGSPGDITVPPADNDGDYDISWEASLTNGVTYVVEEATDGSFTTGLRTAYTGTALSASVTGRESGTTYYYRVKAAKTGYADSAWAAGANGCVVSYPAGAPGIPAVPPADDDGDYDISWGASITNGVTYVLEEATDSAFTADVRTIYPGTGLSASISGRPTGATYYYRVKATGAGYTDSDWVTGSNGCLVVFVAADPGILMVPPADDDGDYDITWGASITNGVTYVLEEATDSAFTADVRTVYPGAGLSAPISGRPTGATYYYRIKATKPGYTDSGWVEGAHGCEVSYPAGAPGIPAVPPADDDGDYDIGWGASITNGVTYVLEEATDSAFTADVRTLYPGTGLSAAISGRPTGATYYYRIKATKPGYTDSGWVEGANGCVVSYPAGAPGIPAVPPADDDGDYDITWGASITNGVTYVLEEATDSAFTIGLRTAYTGPNLNFTISGRPTGATYYYRVKATRAGYTDSAWVEGANGCVVSYPAGAPGIPAVPPADDDGDYDISWGASITNGVTYVLEEATDSAFTADVRTIYPGTGLSASISGRPTGATYYYRVKATGAGYTDSAWVEGGNGCSVSYPAAVPGVLTVPLTNDNGEYDIIWEASLTNGVTYVLEEATDSAFTAGLRTAYTGPNLNSTISGRAFGTTYYYRVKATRAGYTDSAWVEGGNGCSVNISEVSCPDTGFAECLERLDGGPDGDNLVGDVPRLDIDYEFVLNVMDTTGNQPQHVRLYMAQRDSPSSSQFYAHDMACSGDFTTGATCAYVTGLGPAAVHTYFFEVLTADGALLRYPGAGYLTGPQVSLLNGYNLVGIPRDVSAAGLDGNEAFGTSSAYRWDGSSYTLVTSSAPAVAGEGYFIYAATGTLPLHDGIGEVQSTRFEYQLQPGWNIITNPYGGNVLLSAIQVQRNEESLKSWTDAAASGWLDNAVYFFQGTDWGGTYDYMTYDGVTGASGALVPWVGYWVHVNDAVNTYKLIISKP